MFTGIVEELGRIESLDGSRMRIGAHVVLADVTLGASIAVNGCCLTVVEFGRDYWEADLSEETLERTSLRFLRSGDQVNLERPVRLEDRLGGHLVQGHVDAVGVVVRPAPDLQVRMPQDLLRYVVVKGSVTIDGVSLTVVEVLDDGFTVALIPHTCEVTTFGTRQQGDYVNLEVDVMAKYAERLLAGYLPQSEQSSTYSNHEGVPTDE
ncbi:MAG: riboflavin synthase [Actinobacteria bacterium]|uniref:Riboflavin synthase n=1 Tax=freshwater metagenome TaxID=449393 RepID=A0A6J6T9I5_9ZZZZ|nr:riboflavin synthase [Actinomycetota bacterium]